MRCVRADGRLLFDRRAIFPVFLPALALVPFLFVLEDLTAFLDLCAVDADEVRCFGVVSSEDCPPNGVTTISAARRPARNRAGTCAGVGEIAALIVSL